MTHDERQALYRDRLRGLYVDLGKLLLQLVTEFTSSRAIEELKQILTHIVRGKKH